MSLCVTEFGIICNSSTSLKLNVWLDFLVAEEGVVIYNFVFYGCSCSKLEGVERGLEVCES